MESSWSTYLDLNTFLRHFLVGELSGNTDTYWSVFMYKDRDDQMFYTGPVWDFDLAFENDNRTFPVNSKSDYIYRSGGSCAGNMKTFVDNIVVRNANARAQLVEIWDEARQSGLNEENMVAFIDSLEQELDLSQQLNFIRWPIMNTYVHQIDYNLPYEVYNLQGRACGSRLEGLSPGIYVVRQGRAVRKVTISE